MPQSKPDLVKAYFNAIEIGDLERLVALLSPGIEQIEWPNQIKLKGDRRSLAALRGDFEKGQALLQSQRYQIDSLTEAGDLIVAEVFWQGILAIPVGSLKPGDTMTAHSAIVFEVKHGQITAQRNYDCFDPLA